MNGNENGRMYTRCRNCGEVMTGAASGAGSLFPVGLADDGYCGDGKYELLTDEVVEYGLHAMVDEQ